MTWVDARPVTPIIDSDCYNHGELGMAVLIGAGIVPGQAVQDVHAWYFRGRGAGESFRVDCDQGGYSDKSPGQSGRVVV